MKNLSSDIPENLILQEFIASLLFCLVLLPLLLWYQRRRHFFPINGCDPYYLLVFGYTLFIMYISEALSWFLWYPCAISQILKGLCYLLMVTVFVARAWNLFYRFQITSVLVELNSKKDRDSASVLDNWYVRYRILARPFVVNLFIAFNWSIALFYFLFDLFQPPPQPDWCPLTFLNRLSGSAGHNHLLIFSFFSLILAYKLYRIKGRDAYGVKKELGWCTLNALVWQIITIIYGMMVGDAALVLNGWEFWYRILAILPGFYFSLALPIYRSYKYQKSELQNLPQIPFTLAHLLSHDEGIASFLNYLKKEFSTENLLFYIRVNEWLELANKHPSLQPSCDPPTISPRSTSSPTRAKSFFPPLPTTPTQLHSQQQQNLLYSPSLSSSQPMIQSTSLSSLSSLLPPSATTQPLLTTTATTTTTTTTTTQQSSTTIAQNSPTTATRDAVIQFDIDLSQRAYSLLEIYLTEYAKFSVNLSYHIRQKAVEAIEQFGSSGQSLSSLSHLITVFETTKNEIFKLMESDSFTRYINSSEYTEYSKNAPLPPMMSSQLASYHQQQQQQLPHSLHHLSLIIEEQKSSQGTGSKGGSGGGGGDSKASGLGSSSKGGGGGSGGGSGGGGGGIGEEIEMMERFHDPNRMVFETVSTGTTSKGTGSRTGAISPSSVNSEHGGNRGSELMEFSITEEDRLLLSGGEEQKERNKGKEEERDRFIVEEIET